MTSSIDDGAETAEGRISCWRANATGPSLLARACAKRGITLVHVSSDYVFDGVRASHDELEPLSPLSVYGQAKAAGDLAVAGCPSHYIVRSSWVIGDGRNFVRSMAALSDRVADAGFFCAICFFPSAEKKRCEKRSKKPGRKTRSLFLCLRSMCASSFRDASGLAWKSISARMSKQYNAPVDRPAFRKQARNRAGSLQSGIIQGSQDWARIDGHDHRRKTGAPPRQAGPAGRF